MTMYSNIRRSMPMVRTTTGVDTSSASAGSSGAASTRSPLECRDSRLPSSSSSSFSMSRATSTSVCLGSTWRVMQMSPNWRSASIATTWSGPAQSASVTATLVAVTVLPAPPLGDMIVITLPMRVRTSWAASSSSVI